MSADTKQHPGSFERTWWRVAAVVWVAGLVAVLVAWLAAAPASAQALSRDGTVFVHSAGSGALGGGKLTLHGVGRRVIWAHNSGRSGVIAVKRMHRMLFRRESPAATGILHVAGHRGGDELTFKLSRPRYNRERRTVSYKVMRMRGRLPGRAASAAGIPRTARRFGPASLTVQGAPSPSVSIQQTTYTCPQGGTCWGTLLASGLPPGTDLSGFAPQVPGNTGQGVGIDARADGNGNVNVPLNLLCSNDYHVTNPNVSFNPTSVTPSVSASMPQPPCG